MTRLHGMDVIVSPHMVVPCENFSHCRSPSRARRRWKQRGIRGRGIFEKPHPGFIHDHHMNVLICHPVRYYQLLASLENNA